MTTVTDTASFRGAPLRGVTGEGVIAALALALSLGLAVMGVFAAEYPHPAAAAGDPFLFWLRP